MKSYKQIYFLLNIFILIQSCGLKNENSTGGDVNPFSEESSDVSISAGLASLAGVLQMGNDAGGTISAVGESEQDFDLLTTCGKPATTQTCFNGSKTIQYSECSLLSGVTYSGSVTLIYSENDCDLTSGKSLTRRVSMDRNGFFDTSIRTNTLSHSDYRGNTLGAPVEGARLLKTADGFTVDIYGTRKIRTSSTGSILYDISTRTLSANPLVVTGDLNGTRTINSGTVEVIHNTKKYVATFIPTNLIYSSATCCHPTSGTLDITFSGSVTGTGQVTFKEQCGVVAFVRDGVRADLKLHGCE